MFLLVGSLTLAVLTLALPRVRLIGLGTLIVLTGWTNHTLHTAILSPHDLRLSLGEQPEQASVLTIDTFHLRSAEYRRACKKQIQLVRTLYLIAFVALALALGGCASHSVKPARQDGDVSSGELQY